jgi:ubiquinone/menaquinone biosynthesis C-methylase UbiE
MADGGQRTADGAPPRVDYDRVAPTYDERYRAGGPAGIAESLSRVVEGARRVLEVGCGTGHWLDELAPRVAFACGLDRSRGMLDRAGGGHRGRLVQGDACALPFRAAAVDALFCVNALHHFPQPAQFVAEAARVLAPGGALAVIGMDPTAGRDRWYLYDHFPGTRQTDERRYPAATSIAAWMERAGLRVAHSGVAARIHADLAGRDVYGDPILSKNGTSQLTLLSDADFAAGMARIEAAVVAGEASGSPARFEVDLWLALVIAGKEDRG